MITDKYTEFVDGFYTKYDEFLASIFSKEYWESGEYNYHRINWKNARKAKLELQEFNQSGIYIWGVDETPLYIGKAAKQSFAKRFSRYIGGAKSQCRLAEKYWRELEQGGRKKSHKEIKIEYGIGKSRAIGVKTFGECNSDKIWFILIPFTQELISGLEEALLIVGKRWNVDTDCAELINVH